MHGLGILNEKINRKDDVQQEDANRTFKKLVKVCLLMGIIIVSGFIVFYLLTPEEGYIGFGILNSREEAEDYPTVVRTNQPVEFYITVENELDRPFSFKLKIYKGDNFTKLSSDGSEYAHYNYSTDKEKLRQGEEWMSDKLSITFNTNGSGQILIVELWEYSDENGREFYDILWLRLNVVD
ncbi:MAG: DUF1616 domain-containing protein [Candidatus Lokiarchaeota archaeon]|nr:DUF1616 domain-containing protein [Candidatus Lokiarchaeota archaeon]MBD3339902.1 DUF1616 domain-containing protein [Candidatus Lokiarchaeota archaeon]